MRLLDTDMPWMKMARQGTIVNTNTAEREAYLKRSAIANQKKTEQNNLEARLNKLEDNLDTILKMLQQLAKGE